MIGRVGALPGKMSRTGMDSLLKECSQRVTSGEPSVQSAFNVTTSCCLTSDNVSSVLSANFLTVLQVAHHCAVKSIRTVWPCLSSVSTTSPENGFQGSCGPLGCSSASPIASHQPPRQTTDASERTDHFRPAGEL